MLARSLEFDSAPFRRWLCPDAWARLALLTVVVGAVACGEEAPPPAAPVARPVKMITVNSAGPRSTSEYPGRIAAWQHAEMAFEVPGKIIDFPFVEGDRIDKGTVIAKLDSRDFESAFKSAQAVLARTKADYERYQKLFDEGVTSKAELEARRQAYEVAQAEMETARKAIEDAQLVAPFSGNYAKKLVDDFQNVRAKQPVMILQDDSKLKIVVSVPESDMAGRNRERLDVDRITERIEPKVVISSIPDRPIDARLYELSMTADPVTRTFDATFVIDNPDDMRIFPGMTAQVITQRPLGDVGSSRIPGRAVFADETGATFVWVVDESTSSVQKRAVTLGPPSGDTVEVLSGLVPGDVIVTSGVGELREGSLVTRYER